MLILARKQGESIIIGREGKEITITVNEIEAGRTIICVTAKDGTPCVVTLGEREEEG